MFLVAGKARPKIRLQKKKKLRNQGKSETRFGIVSLSVRHAPAVQPLEGRLLPLLLRRRTSSGSRFRHHLLLLLPAEVVVLLVVGVVLPPRGLRSRLRERRRTLPLPGRRGTPICGAGRAALLLLETCPGSKEGFRRNRNMRRYENIIVWKVQMFQI